jgi:hypothetical protein
VTKKKKKKSKPKVTAKRLQVIGTIGEKRLGAKAIATILELINNSILSVTEGSQNSVDNQFLHQLLYARHRFIKFHCPWLRNLEPYDS